MKNFVLVLHFTQNFIRTNRLHLFDYLLLGNVLPPRAQRKKLFRACCLWQGYVIPHVYKGRCKAQTAVLKEILSRTPAAATAVTRKSGSCIAVINQWNVVRNVSYQSLKSDI